MAAVFREGGGMLSVEAFMRLALYDPAHGYYSRNVKTVGRGGDFSTSATLHGALGEAIADWIDQKEVIEVGAGDGSLAESVLSTMGWWRRRKVKYRIVDTSAPLVTRQRERLARFGSRVEWHASVAGALAASDGMADVFSNELVDAFPAVSLRWNAGLEHWEEVFVSDDGAETFRRSEFQAGWQPNVDGQRIERHRSFHEWWEEWLPRWKRGRMLTIDYGAPFPEVYHRRPMGTLRAYFAQMRLDGAGEFYQRAGRQDLTADVNFTDLANWGETLGLSETRLRTQREFLLAMLPGLEARAANDAALGFLLDEAGAGGAFCVLEQQRT